MIVCHCAIVNDRTVHQAIASGATSISEIAARCRAGARCGGCHDTIEQALLEHTTPVKLAVA